MDPLRANIELFSHAYFWFKVVFVLFLSSLYLMTLYVGLGYNVNVGQFVTLGIAALFAFIGLALPKMKKNYMIGIRLPWTLHSEVVWDKTHQFGGQLFLALAAIVALASFLSAPWTFAILLGGIIILLVLLVAYSYMKYRKISD